MEYSEEKIKAIQNQLKLIPNGIDICVEDLDEIFSQKEKWNLT